MATTPRLPQGLFASGRVIVLHGYSGPQIAASTGDAFMVRFVLPCDATVIGGGFAMTVAGSSSTVTDLKVTDETGSGTVLSDVLAPATGAGEKTDAWDFTNPMKGFPKHTEIKVTLDTATDTTVDDMAIYLVVQPISSA